MTFETSQRHHFKQESENPFRPCARLLLLLKLFEELIVSKCPFKVWPSTLGTGQSSFATKELGANKQTCVMPVENCLQNRFFKVPYLSFQAETSLGDRNLREKSYYTMSFSHFE